MMRRPRFIAEQARNAHGILGRLIAFIMARETWAQNRRAVDALDIKPGDHILDLGCGPGRALATLAAKAPRGHVVGVDPSKLMAEIASKRNRRLIRKKRVEIFVSGVDSLPFKDATFDKILCVHVIYFWPNLDEALRQIAWVLKPKGQIVLLFRTDADQEAVKSFPAEVYRFRPLDEIVAALKRAGLEPLDTSGNSLALVCAERA